MADKVTQEEPKLTLPTGHPSAGYVGPDLSFSDGAGTLPEEEQKAVDERDEAQKKDAEAVANAEHEAATKEQKAGEETAEAPEEKPATTRASRSSG